MTSLVGQVTWLFEQHRGTGQSRREWRDQNPGFGQMAPVTFAWSTEKRCRAVGIQFVKFCEQHYRIRQIRQITTEMLLAYIDQRKAADLSSRTLATEVTALRRLGMYAVLQHWLAHNFVPKDLSIPHGSQPRYSYAPASEQKIIEAVAAIEPLAGEVLRVQRDFGLRLNEAVRLRTDCIHFENNTIQVKGKGGRLRTIESEQVQRLAALDRSRLYPLLKGNAVSWKRRIERLVREACAKYQIACLGTHGFRAGAAQRTLDDLQDSGMLERAARQQVAKLLGHNRTAVTRSYAP
jgi:integrase